jgi:hypothetical protein
MLKKVLFAAVFHQRIRIKRRAGALRENSPATAPAPNPHTLEI